MCGICGFTGPSNHDLLRRMTETLYHRGPDDSGYFEDEHTSLGVRRLSIIDVPKGHQPMSNEDGSVWIVFNGEIYNYEPLRDELSKKGHSFTTQSDTETIVHAYEEFDLDFVSHLWGMFALAIWDTNRKRLIIARDRIGMKPLYYAHVSNALVFSSEQKALLLHDEVHRVPDLRALRLLFAFRYTPTERTAFAGVTKLLPGHMLVRERGDERIRRYWRLSIPSEFETDETTLIANVRRLVSD